MQKKFECFTQKKSYIDVKAQRKGTGRKLTQTLRGNTQLEAGQQAKRFKKEFPCVKEFSNFNFLGLSYLFDMIFCVLKPYFTIFCCFRPDCCIIQKKLLPCYFRSSSISINTQGHRKHILSFIFLLQ